MEEKIKDYGWERGEESEKKVFEILEELKTAGIIKDFGQSFRFGLEDLSGRDMAIVTLGNGIIWLQVKSSFNQDDKEKYQRRGIHYLAVGKETPEEIKKEILEILRKEKRRKAKKRKTELQI